MSVAEALKAARAAGIQVGIDGDAIVLEAEHAPPSQVLAMLRAHKPEIIELFARSAARSSGIDDHFKSRRLVGALIAEATGARMIRSCRSSRGGPRRPSRRLPSDWLAEQEAEARVALGIEPPGNEGRRRFDPERTQKGPP